MILNVMLPAFLAFLFLGNQLRRFPKPFLAKKHQLRRFLKPFLAFFFSCSTIALAGAKLDLGLTGPLPENWHPFLATGDDATYLRGLILEPLFIYDDDGRGKSQLTCNLCKEFPTLANGGLVLGEGETKTRITFEMVADRYWGDGQPITGEDVEFSFQVGQVAAREGEIFGLWRRVAKVTVSGDKKQFVSIDFADHHYLFDDLNEVFLLPSHIEAPRWTRAKHDFFRYLQESMYVEKPNEPGLYNGPFYIEQITPQIVKLAANPKLKTEGNIAALQVWHSLAPAKLASMDILPEHICWQNNCDEIEKARTKPGRRIEADSTRLELLVLNLRNPIFRDPFMRQSIRTTIDRDAGMYEKNAGQQLIPANSFVPVGDQYFSANIPFWPYDPKKAIHWFDENGWRLNKGGKREKDGETLSLELQSDDSPHRLALANSIKKSLESVGIVVDMKNQPASVYFGRTVKRMQFLALALLSVELRVDADYSALFGDQAIPNVRNDYEGQNFSAWLNPRVKDIFEQLSKEFDPAKRVRLTEQLQQQYLRDLPSFPLGFYRKRALVNAELRGFFLPSSPQPSSLYSKKWQMPLVTSSAK